MKSDTLILIPARYQSVRFPGKPLALINQQSMIQRVFNLCQETGFETFVVTDNDEIEQNVRTFSENVLRVDDDVASGTERIALAFDRHLRDRGAKYIINVQGDEPLLKASSLQNLRKFHEQRGCDVGTMVRRETDASEKTNPSRVKVVFNPENGTCLYFSREPIPHQRDGAGETTWFHHVGVYSYTPESLMKFQSLPASPLEKSEGLEQLRGLENGFSYGAVEIKELTLGVDIPDDVSTVEGLLSEESN